MPPNWVSDKTKMLSALASAAGVTMAEADVIMQGLASRGYALTPLPRVTAASR